jgi:hypothetical protein
MLRVHLGLLIYLLKPSTGLPNLVRLSLKIEVISLFSRIKFLHGYTANNFVHNFVYFIPRISNL